MRTYVKTIYIFGLQFVTQKRLEKSKNITCCNIIRLILLFRQPAWISQSSCLLVLNIIYCVVIPYQGKWTFMAAARPEPRISHHLTVQWVKFGNHGNRTYIVWPYKEGFKAKILSPYNLASNFMFHWSH